MGTWCDMAHSVVYTYRHEWDGCSAMTSSPKPFHFLNASHSALIWQNMPTPTNWSSLQEYISFDTHVTVPQGRGTGGWADIDNCWWNTPWHSLPHHPPIKAHPLSFFFLSLSTLTQHALAWGHSAIVPTSLFRKCVVDMASVGQLTNAHIMGSQVKIRWENEHVPESHHFSHKPFNDELWSSERLWLPHSPCKQSQITNLWMKWFMISCYLLCLQICIYHPVQVEWVLCLIPIPHQVLLLQCLQLRCLLKRKEKEWFVGGCLLCILFLPLHFILSSVSVVFDFNASLNDVAPMSPTLLPVYEKRKEKVFCWCMV